MAFEFSPKVMVFSPNWKHWLLGALYITQRENSDRFVAVNNKEELNLTLLFQHFHIASFVTQEEQRYLTEILKRPKNWRFYGRISTKQELQRSSWMQQDKWRSMDKLEWNQSSSGCAALEQHSSILEQHSQHTDPNCFWDVAWSIYFTFLLLCLTAPVGNWIQSCRVFLPLLSLAKRYK